jgi:hypothetical protein
MEIVMRMQSCRVAASCSGDAKIDKKQTKTKQNKTI